MQRILAAVIASTFAFGSVAGYAKQEQLSTSERADLRARADRLETARANGTEESRDAQAMPVANKKRATHHRKTTRHTVKKSTTTTTRTQ